MYWKDKAGAYVHMILVALASFQRGRCHILISTLYRDDLHLCLIILVTVPGASLQSGTIERPGRADTQKQTCCHCPESWFAQRGPGGQVSLLPRDALTSSLHSAEEPQRWDAAIDTH